MYTVHGCTAIAFSAGAMTHGYPVTTHTVDCTECDPRVALIPSRDNKENTERVVYGQTSIKSELESERAAIYSKDEDVHTHNSTPQDLFFFDWLLTDHLISDVWERIESNGINTNNLPKGTPIDNTPQIMTASIPEISHTYALWESSYGMMNEFGLNIGESTCGTSLPHDISGLDMKDDVGDYGVAKLSIYTLIVIALERCKDSRCAIHTMGDLSTKFGFYGEDPRSGEALVISDRETKESWIFHILPSFDAKSSVWVAQRVPEGHIAPLANVFIIKEMDLSGNNHDFLFSDNILKEANLFGYNDKENLSFANVFGNDIPYLYSYYTVRMWRVFQLADPNFKFELDPKEYPFSMQVKTTLTVKDIMDLHRDYYDNTEFDLRKGLLSEPFGNPNIIEGGPGLKTVGGVLPRSFSISRTTLAVINNPGEKESICWIAIDQPATSVYVPFLASTLQQSGRGNSSIYLPKGSLGLYSHSYQIGNKMVMDWGGSAFWAFNFVNNWMTLNYKNMDTQYVSPLINILQNKILEEIGKPDFGTADAKIIQDKVVTIWWKLANFLVMRYVDGHWNAPNYDPTQTIATGYPVDFLKRIGMDNTFFRAHFHEPGFRIPRNHLIVFTIIICLISLLMGYMLRTWLAPNKKYRDMIRTTNNELANPMIR